MSLNLMGEFHYIYAMGSCTLSSLYVYCCIQSQPELKGLIYKNLQKAAEEGMAPRQMIPSVY